MKNKLPAIVFASLMGTLVLTGCPGPSSAKDVITIAIVSDNSESNTMTTFIKAYKAQPGHENQKFKVVKMTNYHDYIFNSFLYDELADIVQVFDISCGYYTNGDLDGAGNSLLQSVTPFMQRDGIQESDFFESIIDMTKCKVGSDEMYWIPRDYNKVVCAYNKKMFDIAEIAYPTDSWTWADFVSTCQALKAKEAKIKQYSGSATFFPVDLNMDFEAVYYPLLKSYGGELIDAATRTCFGPNASDVEIAKNAWGKLLGMADSKLANAPGGAQIPFTNKQAAMMFMVRPNLPTYVKGLGADTIDFVSLPTYEDLESGQTSYIGMGCSGYGMTTACPDSKKEMVWDFLKFIISVEGQEAFSAAGSGIPCLKALANNPYAEFRKYLVTDSYCPNHDAFVAYPERDLSANFLGKFEVEKQLTLEKYVKDRTLHSFYQKTGSARDAYYTEYKTNMEKIWKK